MHLDSILGSRELCQECQEVMKTLRIDIPRFFQDMNEHDPLRQSIICKSLRGNTPTEIAKSEPGYNPAHIRNILHSSIYPMVLEILSNAELEDNQEIRQIAGNWARIINYLLRKYRLGDPCLIPNLNTLISFGNYIFLRRMNPNIFRFQMSAARDYSDGDYYSAFAKFLRAWLQEREIDSNGNPETLIYLLNCLLEYSKQILDRKKIPIYTIAVVVPIEHNSGKVAAELLYGVAQMHVAKCDSL